MLDRTLDWLEANRWLNFFILFFFFFAIVLPHQEIGSAIGNIFRPYSRGAYNRILLFASLSIFLFYLVIIYRGAKDSNNKIFLAYFVITCLLATVCYNMLFVMNVEAIHFIQYGLFTVICYPLVNNYSLTMMYAVLAGAVDEAYQFYYLAPERTDYYDFNDVIINLVGAAFGLLLIRSLQRKSYKYRGISFFKSKHFILFVSGILVKNYDPQNLKAQYWLIRKPAQGFWNVIKVHDFKFHVVQPWEGLGIIAMLFFVYSGIYKGVDLLNKD